MDRRVGGDPGLVRRDRGLRRGGQGWIEDWEKKGKPTDEAEKEEEAKGFLKKLFGGFGKKN